MTHVFCMQDKEDYKHTPCMCSTYCFSTAAMVTRTRPNVTLYAHCVSCLHVPLPFSSLPRRKRQFCYSHVLQSRQQVSEHDIKIWN